MTRCLWLLLGCACALALPACQSRKAAPSTGGTPVLPLDNRGADLFAELTTSSGIGFAYRNGEETSPHLAILESLGGGVALIDIDNDGLLDVFLPGGGYFDGPGKKSILGHPCKLYKNLGGFKLKDVTKESGLEALAGGKPWFYTHAAAVGDYDRDGFSDLLVTGWGRVALFHNEPAPGGGRTFVDVSQQAGLATGITWATSAVWADFDGDGFSDLYICQYVNWSFDNHPSCDYDGKTPDVCPPKKFKGLPHRVFHNRRDGTFQDVSDEAGLLKGGDGGKGLGVIAVDVNSDGKPDVYVTNDTVDNYLYMNRSSPGKIRFTEEGVLAGVARDGGGSANGSMGVDAGDPDGSGLPWLWVTNYEKELHALYRNRCEGDRTLFLFYTPASGIAALGQQFVGWGTAFVDLDHHGWEDLFIVNGHAIRYPTGAARRQLPVLMRNEGGRFKTVTSEGGAYFKEAHLARGVGFGDLDNDGRIDAVVSHLNDPVAVLRNTASSGNHWVGFSLQAAGNGDFVGARVVLEAAGRKQTRFAKGGGSYASSCDRRLVFGLGKVDQVERVTVFWPGGKQQTWENLAIDRYHTLPQQP